MLNDDEIKVVLEGEYYENEESAIIAKDEANKAEKWAKYAEEQANDAENYAGQSQNILADVIEDSKKTAKNADRAEYWANNAEVRYQSLYQKMKGVENGIIVLEDEKIINYCEVSSSIALSLNLDNITKKENNDIITFELYLNQMVASAITWFSGITWANGEPPDLSEVHLYLFTFRSFDNGLTWQGGLQCFF